MEQILAHIDSLVGFYPATNQQEHVAGLIEYCLGILKQSRGFEDASKITNGGVNSLYASSQGTNRPKVLLQAHIDVVPAGIELRTMQIANNRLIGRGVFDMLYATACYLTFVERHQEDIPLLDFGIMLTGDEEIGGMHGANYLVELGHGTDICVLPDAGLGFGDLNAAAKGVYNFKLVVNGKAHHGARPWEGDGAANKLVRLLSDLLKEFDSSSRDNSTLTVAMLSAGDADNKGPAQASARLDIRYSDKEDLARIKHAVERLLKKYNAHIEDLQLASDYQLNVQNPLVRQFIELYETHAGKPVSFSKAHGSSDARFFAARDIPVIMLRPKGGGGHGDEEWISINEIEKFYKLLEDYIMKAARL